MIQSCRCSLVVPAGNYIFKVNNRNTSFWRRSGVFIVNFEHISHLVLVFLLLTLSRLNAGWGKTAVDCNYLE